MQPQTDLWPTLGTSSVEKHRLSEHDADLMGVAFILMTCRVFVLVDPSVCSEHLQEAIREHVNASHVSRDKTEVQINVILHVLRAGLGMKCHSSKVSQCLKVCCCDFCLLMGLGSLAILGVIVSNFFLSVHFKYPLM